MLQELRANNPLGLDFSGGHSILVSCKVCKRRDLVLVGKSIYLGVQLQRHRLKLLRTAVVICRIEESQHKINSQWIIVFEVNHFASCLYRILALSILLDSYQKTLFKCSVENRDLGILSHDRLPSEATAVGCEVAVFAGRKACYPVSNATH
jgi:hypothetical protein